MQTPLSSSSKFSCSGITGKFTAILGSVILGLSLQVSHGDIPDQSSGEFRGIYKVTSSTDPAFPTQANREWFLDFGNGISSGKFSGTVAVSLRQNPSVKVRIMVWQYFPKQGRLIIGEQAHEGARTAVALGNWQMAPASRGVTFERENYRVVLHQVDPRDY